MEACEEWDVCLIRALLARGIVLWQRRSLQTAYVNLGLARHQKAEVLQSNACTHNLAGIMVLNDHWAPAPLQAPSCSSYKMYCLNDKTCYIVNFECTN